MDKFFRITESGSTVKTEIVAGLTTFFALAYIILVQPSQLAAGGAAGWLAAEGADAAALGQVWNAVYIAGILAAIVGTMIMALYAKLPFALACGMGLNSFFCTSFMVNGFFATGDVILSYQTGLVIIFVSGLVFLVLSVTGAREYIAKALPDCLKKSIPAGIGLFIAFIGFKNAGIIQANQYTFVQFTDFHGLTWAETCPALAALIGFILIAILTKKKVPGSIIIGILATAVLYYVFVGQAPSFDMSTIGQSFKDFGAIGFAGLFSGEAWSAAFSADWVGGLFGGIMLVVAFCLVDMFDTVGTLYGTAAEADLLDENGDPIRVNKAMTADSVATVAGAVLGTSTTTTFVESSAGVAAGGKTGFTGVVISACFVIALFFSPVASVIPSAACAPALIYVGVLMLKNFSSVDMKDVASAVPAFVTLVMMPLTYSISNGIGLGCIAYILIALFTGGLRKKDWVVAIIGAFFILRFVCVTM